MGFYGDRLKLQGDLVTFCGTLLNYHDQTSGSQQYK